MLDEYLAEAKQYRQYHRFQIRRISHDHYAIYIHVNIQLCCEPCLICRISLSRWRVCRSIGQSRMRLLIVSVIVRHLSFDDLLHPPEGQLRASHCWRRDSPCLVLCLPDTHEILDECHVPKSCPEEFLLK